MTDVENVGNRNVQKRQINDIGVQNVRYKHVQKRQICLWCTKCNEQKCLETTDMTLVYKM